MCIPLSLDQKLAPQTLPAQPTDKTKLSLWFTVIGENSAPLNWQGPLGEVRSALIANCKFGVRPLFQWRRLGENTGHVQTCWKQQDQKQSTHTVCNALIKELMDLLRNSCNKQSNHLLGQYRPESVKETKVGYCRQKGVV